MEKKDSLALSAATIRSAANGTAVREVSSQKEQFRQFGIMADWDTKSTYRTLGMSMSLLSIESSNLGYIRPGVRNEAIASVSANGK